MSAKRPLLRLGVVGLGRWGQVLTRSTLAEGAGSETLLRVVAAYTRSPAKVRDFVLEAGFRLFDSYEALIGSGEVDAVVIASPHSQHVAQIVAAVRQGLHVFCEKPLALDLESARNAVAAGEEAGRVLAVGFNRRFLPAYQRLLHLVSSRGLGRILHVEGNFSGPFGLGYKPGVWHVDRSETPAGGMTLMGVHVLDAMIGVAGKVARVQARSRRQVLEVDLDDTTDVLLDFDGGCTGYLSTLTATARQWRLQVFGTAGWAQMTDQDRLVVHLVGGEPEETAFAAVSTERAELDQFARAVLFGHAYPVPNDEVLNGIGTLEAIIESLRSPARVEVPAVSLAALRSAP